MNWRNELRKQTSEKRVIDAVFFSARPFSTYGEILNKTGLSRGVLSKRLKSLVGDGVLEDCKSGVYRINPKYPFAEPNFDDPEALVKFFWEDNQKFRINPKYTRGMGADIPNRVYRKWVKFAQPKKYQKEMLNVSAKSLEGQKKERIEFLKHLTKEERIAFTTAYNATEEEERESYKMLDSSLSKRRNL